MRIGIAGPMTLELLRPHLPDAVRLPRGYPFPMTALLVAELLEMGHEVTAFTTSTDIAEPYVVSNAPFTLCVAPSRPRHRARGLFREEIDGLTRVLRAHPCDVVHAHWTYEFALAALASGMPPLVTVHDSATAVLLQFRDAHRLVRWMLNARTLRRAPYLSAVSPYIWSALPQPAKQRAAIIPNFVSHRVGAQVLPPEARGSYVISVCNGFTRLKNLQTALLGFHQALSRVLGIRYVLVGQDCEVGGPAYRFCEEHGCLDNVVFAGPVPYAQVLEKVAGAAIMLHPSYEESFGMSVLEAMALGTPVVAGDHSGNMPNLIENGRTGWLCDVSSPAAIADALCALFAGRALRDRIGEAARDTACKKYSAPVVVNQYLNAYKRVLAGHPLTPESCLCN